MSKSVKGKTCGFLCFCQCHKQHAGSHSAEIAKDTSSSRACMIVTAQKEAVVLGMLIHGHS